jgi:integrase
VLGSTSRSTQPATSNYQPWKVKRSSRHAEEAIELLDVLRQEDRTLWATALYAGLRCGELQALRWEAVDLATGKIQITETGNWDPKAHKFIRPKSKKGVRTVPIAAVLRGYLAAQKLRTGGTGLVFGATPERPFTASNVWRRAHMDWRRANKKREKEEQPLLAAIGLHECRHCYVSMMHAARLSLEQIGDYVGHTSAYMTHKYRHLRDGHEAEAARRQDAYLERVSQSVGQ